MGEVIDIEIVRSKMRKDDSIQEFVVNMYNLQQQYNTHLARLTLMYFDSVLFQYAKLYDSFTNSR